MFPAISSEPGLHYCKLHLRPSTRKQRFGISCSNWRTAPQVVFLKNRRTINKTHHELLTPPKIHIEPKREWFGSDDFPFQHEWFSAFALSPFIFPGVKQHTASCRKSLVHPVSKVVVKHLASLFPSLAPGDSYSVVPSTPWWTARERTGERNGMEIMALRLQSLGNLIFSLQN